MYGMELITMRVLICDDDHLILEQLTKYIREFFKRRRLACPEIVCFSNGETLLSDNGEKDILFLDIEMPGMNGIYVGNELKKLNKDIIIFIVTSYTEYLDEAMRFHVFRYLSKPIEKHRLFRNLKDAIELYNTSTQKLPIETKEGIYTVSASDIIAVEAQGRKVIIHTSTKDYSSIHTMQHWVQSLSDHCFFQTHRSFIINFEHVTNFNHSLVYLSDNQFEAYLTRRKYTQFKEAYFLYLESTR